MSAPSPSAFNEEVLLTPPSLHGGRVTEADWQGLRQKPSIGDSLTAVAVLLVYVAAYAAAGRAGLALVEWAWVAIFR